MPKNAKKWDGTELRVWRDIQNAKWVMEARKDMCQTVDRNRRKSAIEGALERKRRGAPYERRTNQRTHT